MSAAWWVGAVVLSFLLVVFGLVVLEAWVFEPRRRRQAAALRLAVRRELRRQAAVRSIREWSDK